MQKFLKIFMELQNQIVSDYQNWKQYGSSWLGQMMDKGRQLLISQWWWRKPKKPVGKGKITVEKSIDINYSKIKEAKVKVKF